MNLRLPAAAALVLLTAACYQEVPGPTVTVTPPAVTVTAYPTPGTVPSGGESILTLGSGATAPTYTTTVLSYGASRDGSDQTIVVRTCADDEAIGGSATRWSSWTLVGADGQVFDATPEPGDEQDRSIYPNDGETQLHAGVCREGMIRFPTSPNRAQSARYRDGNTLSATWGL